MTNEKKEKKVIIKFDIAEHIPSGCRLVCGEWEADASIEDQYIGAGVNYKNYADIVDVNDKNYNINDDEQEHDEDYRIITEEIEIRYTDEDEERYYEEKNNYEDNRDSFYGWAMNGGGGRGEFQKMYGDGNFPEFGKWLISQ